MDESARLVSASAPSLGSPHFKTASCFSLIIQKHFSPIQNGVTDPRARVTEELVCGDDLADTIFDTVAEGDQYGRVGDNGFICTSGW